MNINQIVKIASTKGITDLKGSNTLFFENDMLFAYNGLIAIQTPSTFSISGSIPAYTFTRLLSQINKDVTIANTPEKVHLSYGRQKASLQKEVDGLKMYKDMAFPSTIVHKPYNKELLEGLSIIKYQNHKGKVSGVYVEGKHAYMVNSSDVACYTFESSYETMWLPPDAVHILLSLKEEWDEYAITSTFLYLKNESVHMAVRLKAQSVYPIKLIKQLLSLKPNKEKAILFFEDVTSTLQRIKVVTSVNLEDKALCHMVTNEDGILIESEGGVDHVREYVDGNSTVTCDVTVPIDAFQLLYNDSDNTVYVLENENGLFLACLNEKSRYMMRVFSK